ncbi:MAG: ABC transporter ATP-binding protein [Chloroflexi bacterium]|nr:ABC transporter ATP-binding protein [Chloroflexota bacterium]
MSVQRTSGPVAVTGPAIRVHELRKRYADIQAVDGVSFEVQRGEIFGMLGPNGAGKTTTVEMMEGLRVPDSGEVRVLDLDATRQASALKQRIGVALQTAALYPNLTVTEIIDLFGSFYRRSRPTQELIDALDLGERRDAATKVLSGGQRQRLSVALALVNDPEVLFLDEPTTGMDPQARRSLWGLVRDLAARGTTVVLTTHYMEEAEELCDRIAVMDHGRVLELGTVSDLVSQRFHERAVRFTDVPALTDPELAALPGATRVVRDQGTAEVWTRDVAATIGGLLALTRERAVEPADLAVRRATLEDLFLELTGRALRD